MTYGAVLYPIHAVSLGDGLGVTVVRGDHEADFEICHTAIWRFNTSISSHLVLWTFPS